MNDQYSAHSMKFQILRNVLTQVLAHQRSRLFELSTTPSLTLSLESLRRRNAPSNELGSKLYGKEKKNNDEEVLRSMCVHRMVTTQLTLPFRDVKLLSFGTDEGGADEEPIVFKKKPIVRPDCVFSMLSATTVTNVALLQCST